MKITADTNVLVRAVVGDDPKQNRIAKTVLENADLVAIPLLVLCEFTWVLSSRYRIPSTEIAEAIRRLIGGANVVVDHSAAEAGLALLDSGGDFADGAIAHEGSWMGAESLVSFDKRAVKLIQAQGGAARLLD